MASPGRHSGRIVVFLLTRVAAFIASPVPQALLWSGLYLLRLVTRTLDRLSPPRSLYAGTPIIAMTVAARAEQHLGIRTDTLVWNTYFITDAFEYRLDRYVSRGPRVWRHGFAYLVLFWACLRYKRFHFYYDRGILFPLEPRQFPEFELQLLHYLGKEVYFYAYGADVRTETRTRALGEFHCCSECPSPGQSCICSEAEGEKNYSRISRYATATFSMGDMIEYTPGSRNDLFYWPIDLEAEKGLRYAPRYPDPNSTTPVQVVHAPNHRGFKGSQYLIAAVEQLQAEGLPVELKLVERVPNRQALEIYRTADIIFDQCLIGFHGYFALEAMAMGKPVMVFIRDPERYLIHPEECPFVNSPKGEVESILRNLIQDRQRLHELGLQGRRYVERYFSLPAYASRLKRVYCDLRVAA